ncbi:ubiquitin-conjugating enzyme E2 L5 isoform X2 [Gallus gallus]|uniref:ubiquitin-conjugating enzyme E2 L5 isoform X2 n=1 Tax=Gallus gallus TaxID=9031 RepID=UPI000240B8DD|nr:ubiquitin-conjugating enzyme E2 L5 isoform X2 [Gallus gallus]|eukprot:XP_003641380.1 ubiquitin-conjugating enzyme E2 L3 isoform X1 [Gallus gallus]
MSRRLAMELEEVRRWGGVRDLQLVDRDVLRWRGLLLPNNPPYNAGAFRFELVFSPHYPLVPPRVTLLTGIHHPGVGPDGTVCQPITSPESWEPLTRITHVLQDLLLLLDNPSTERVLRPELARELSERPEAFLHQAEEHTRRYAEPRPDTPGP